MNAALALEMNLTDDSLSDMQPQNDTFIFYIDGHSDLRRAPWDVLNHSHVYPTYTVGNLKIARINGDRSNLRVDAYPELFWSPMRPTVVGRFGTYKSPYMDFETVAKEAKKSKVVQWHIDPDAYLRLNNLKDFFIDHNYVYLEPSEPPFKPPTVYDARFEAIEEAIERDFELIIKTNPCFVGIFEWYLHAAKKEHEPHISKAIGKLIESTIPDSKCILLKSNIAENVPALKSDLCSYGEVLEVKTVKEKTPGHKYCFYSRRPDNIPEGARVIKGDDVELIEKFGRYNMFDFNKNTCVLETPTELETLRAYVNGQETDLKELIRGKKTFGVFPTHTDALLMFDYR